jgi:cell division transport system ATP-binding protein
VSPLIEFKNVTKVYANGVKALDGLNLSLQNGEFVFVVGHSGAGKSTLVKLLLKEIEPTSGSIWINGTNLSELKHRQIPYYRRNIGVVFQDFRLLPNKTVYENVSLAMEVVGAPRRYIRRQVPLVLGYVGLETKAEQYPHQLSGGEQQRTCLARAIVNNPSILIADEPTGNLDPSTSWEIVQLLDEIHRRGTTIIMVTHARDIVNSLRKRVVTFHNGQIIQDREKGVYIDGV